MQQARRHRVPFGPLAFVLIAAAVAIVGSDVFLPGHHVHTDSDVGHHHHFFFGAHDHGEEDGSVMAAEAGAGDISPLAETEPVAETEPPQGDHHHDHDGHQHGDHHRHDHRDEVTEDVKVAAVESADCENHSVPASDESEDQKPERRSSAGLIDDFPLDKPTTEFRLAAPHTQVLAAFVPVGSPIPASLPFLPGGARAPPAIPLV